MRQRGFIAGVQLYALLALGIAIAGLGAWGFYQKSRAERAVARVNEVTAQRDSAIAAAKANEEAARRLSELNDALSAAIVERDKRAKALEEAKRKLKGELDALKATLPEPDQTCLDRSLPQPLIDRLRLP